MSRRCGCECSIQKVGMSLKPLDVEEHHDFKENELPGKKLGFFARKVDEFGEALLSKSQFIKIGEDAVLVAKDFLLVAKEAKTTADWFLVVTGAATATYVVSTIAPALCRFFSKKN